MTEYNDTMMDHSNNNNTHNNNYGHHVTNNTNRILRTPSRMSYADNISSSGNNTEIKEQALAGPVVNIK